MKWVKTFEKYSDSDEIVETCNDILLELIDSGLTAVVKFRDLLAYEINGNLTEESKKILKININNCRDGKDFPNDEVIEDIYLRLCDYLEGEGFIPYIRYSTNNKTVYGNTVDKISVTYGKYTHSDFEFYRGFKYVKK